MKRPSKAIKTLLWVSELKEREARERFQRACRALSELEALLREITERPKKMFSELEERCLTGLELQFFSRGLEMVFREKVKIEKILENKRHEVENLREQALKLHQKRRTAETLYQKAWQAYRRELEREELKEADDLVLLRRGKDETL